MRLCQHEVSKRVRRAAGVRVSAEARAEAGREGEAVAARYLESLGYEVLARNWSCRVGELDLVVRRGEELVFVEVRTVRRSWEGWCAPEQTVREGKRRRLERAARRWMAVEGGAWVRGCAARFDVVGVRLEARRLRHLRGAFEVSGR